MKFSLFNRKNKQEGVKADCSKLGDFEIISMCQLGDKVAFKELVKRYQKIVYAFLYQLAPEWEDLNDLSQEVFIRVFRGIHSLKSPHAFKSWVNQIVVNIFYDELRKRPKQAKNFSLDQAFEHEEFGQELQRQIIDTSSVPDDVFSNTELKNILQNAISQLPEQYRTVIVLRELQGLQYDEMAELLNCAIGTIKSRLSRAREKLQDIIRPQLGEKSFYDEDYDIEHFA